MLSNLSIGDRRILYTHMREYPRYYIALFNTAAAAAAASVTGEIILYTYIMKFYNI